MFILSCLLSLLSFFILFVSLPFSTHVDTFVLKESLSRVVVGHRLQLHVTHTLKSRTTFCCLGSQSSQHTTPHHTAPHHTTPPHSTAQHITAQHSTAQHTAPHHTTRHTTPHRTTPHHSVQNDTSRTAASSSCDIFRSSGVTSVSCDSRAMSRRVK